MDSRGGGWAIVAQIGLAIAALASLGWNMYWSIHEMPHPPKTHVNLFFEVTGLTWNPTDSTQQLQGELADWKVQMVAENIGSKVAIGCQLIRQDVNQELLPLAYEPVADVPWSAPIGIQHTESEEVAVDQPQSGANPPLEEFWIECATDGYTSQSDFYAIDWNTHTAMLANRTRRVPVPVGRRPFPLLNRFGGTGPCPYDRARTASYCAMKPQPLSESGNFP
jgi:hypothetical protein